MEYHVEHTLAAHHLDTMIDWGKANNWQYIQQFRQGDGLIIALFRRESVDNSDSVSTPVTPQSGFAERVLDTKI